ncbi:hypothetical protein BgiBS90_032064, partial [Biomphalaria glabrata]
MMFLPNTRKVIFYCKIKILLLLVISTLILVCYYNIETTAEGRLEIFFLNGVFIPTTSTSILNTSTDDQHVSKSLKKTPNGPTFQQVNDHDAWLFSAFFNNFNNTELIRVFGIQPLLLKNS